MHVFDKITFISDQGATIKLKDSENLTMNLMNLHLVFEDETKKILGEVNDVNGDTVNASFLGEIVGNRFLGGTIRKPRLDAKVRVINKDEIQLITGHEQKGFMKVGDSPFYDGASVFLDVNNFFSSHFAIFGNSGSGKSCGISRLFQNMFRDKNLNPYNANIIMLDSSGEYYNAFNNLSSIDKNFHYRFISTNEKAFSGDTLSIPIYLLNNDDLALLLQATNHSQLPIIERMRKLALVFSQKDMDANNYKNHLIARAIMTILYTNETAPNKRNEIFSILASCSTPQFNLEAVVEGIGYSRKFRDCFLVDNSGNFSESVLLTEYVSSFIDDELDSYEPTENVFYTLDTLEKALNFTLISEGWLRNKNTYGDAVTLKVRLHSLIAGDMASFFDVREYMTIEQYVKSLVCKDGGKYQFVNINLDDIDDSFAKVITKIFSRLIFDYSKTLTKRASEPFHIIIEEAHRYIQNDTDRFLLGYNIFERIAKEGRKYGVILGIITQRPVELSDTVISQCSNFLIFKMNHPVDVEYIRKMVPNISDEIVEKQKTLQAGTCLGFGSAFRIPMIVKMEMPDPAPWSGNCDVVASWGEKSTASMTTLDGSATKQNNEILEMTNSPATLIEPPTITPVAIMTDTSNLDEAKKVNVAVNDEILNNADVNNTSNIMEEQNSSDTSIVEVQNSNPGDITKPLVSFLGGETLEPAPKMNEVSSKEVNNEPTFEAVPSLVTFNSTQSDGMSNLETNVNSVSQFGNEVNNMTEANTDINNSQDINLGMNSTISVGPEQWNVSNNDTFGKPDFSAINEFKSINQNMSLANTDTQQNSGFISNIPSNMNLAGDGSDNSGDSSMPGAGDKLVNFI